MTDSNWELETGFYTGSKKEDFEYYFYKLGQSNSNILTLIDNLFIYFSTYAKVMVSIRIIQDKLNEI